MELFNKIAEKINKKSSELPKLDSVIPSRALLKKEPEISKAEKKHSTAEMSYKSGDLRQAVIEANQAIKLNPKLIGPFKIMAKIYTESERYIEALRILNRGIEFTGAFELYEMIEEVYELQKNRKEIINMWKKYLRSSRKKDLGYKALGKFYEKKANNIYKAIDYYEKTIEENEVHFDVFEKLGDLYKRDEDYEKSIKTYDKLLFSKHSKEYFRNSSNKARVLTKVGINYFILRDFINAFKYFDMSLQAVPGDRKVYMRLGDMAFYIKDYKAALRYYKLAYKVDKTDIEMIIKHAVASEKMGNYEEAGDLFKRVQKYNPLITNIKEIIESYENEKVFSYEHIKALVEENTDLLIEYEYPDYFKFPENKEELDEMRKQLNSVGGKEDFQDKIKKMKEDEKNKEIDNKEKEKEEFNENEVIEESDITDEENKDSETVEDIEDMSNKEQKDNTENVIDTIENKEEPSSVFTTTEEKKDNSLQKEEIIEHSSNTTNQLESTSIKIEPREEKEPEKESVERERSPEDIKFLMSSVKNYIQESQEIARRYMQIKNLVTNSNNICKDKIKNNMFNMALDNIEIAIKNNSERKEELLKTIIKLKK